MNILLVLVGFYFAGTMWAGGMGDVAAPFIVGYLFGVMGAWIVKASERG